MKPHARRPVPLALFVALLALAGCASGTKLVDRWHDPAFRSGPLRNVYVVAIRKDPVRRRIWEDAYVEKLKEHGVQATASYTQYADAAPDTEQVYDVLQSGKYDGIVMSMRLANEQESRDIPPVINKEAVARRNPYTGFYYTVYRDVYTPGYTEVDEVRRFQTDIWSTKDGGSMVWSGTVRTYDPATGYLVKSVISKHVLPEAAKDGILPPEL